MSLAEPGLQRSRMSWEEYLALPEKPKAEWVDGEVVVSPPVSFEHGDAVMRLGGIFMQALPHLSVVSEVGLFLPRNRLRGPDLMLVEQRPTTKWVTDPPVLVVEVLSPSTRAEDTIRKAPEYAGAGIGQFWVVDPAHRTIDVYANTGHEWETLLLHLDDAHPAGEVTVGEHGVVPVDVRDVFPD